MNEISYGTEGIVKGIQKVLTERSATEEFVFCINALTVLRNVISQFGKDLNDRDIINATMRETALIRTTIGDEKLIQYVHVNMFDLVHPLHRRNVNKQYLRAMNILNDVTPDEGKSSIVETENEITATLMGNKFPHVELKRMLRKNIFKNRTCIMVSSVPTDYYVSEAVRKFKLIDSFTGSIVDKKDLGEKVFGFSCRLDRKLHIAFGDKILIRGIIKYKTKLLNELSKRSPKFTHNQLMSTIKQQIGMPLSSIPFKIP